jgi:hypothetical protein
VQDIKPSVALDLLAVEVERITPADPAVAQGPLVKRRRSIAVLQVRIPEEVARESAMMSPSIPI